RAAVFPKPATWWAWTRRYCGKLSKQSSPGPAGALHLNKSIRVVHSSSHRSSSARAGVSVKLLSTKKESFFTPQWNSFRGEAQIIREVGDLDVGTIHADRLTVPLNNSDEYVCRESLFMKMNTANSNVSSMNLCNHHHDDHSASVPSCGVPPSG